VYPNGFPETFCTDHWRCRFTVDDLTKGGTYGSVLDLLKQISEAGYDVIKTENLCTFDGVPGFSMGQGQ
jgi:isocitrate dehydrogenase